MRSPIQFRSFCTRLAAGALIAVATAAGSGQALAASMVSVKGNVLNMRSGPGTQHEVQWQLHRGFPLKVVQRKGTWLKVQDFEGDSGWVSRRLTSSTPHHIVKVTRANVRSGPGTRYKLLGSAEYGEVLRTLKREGNWVQVRRANNQRGWISKRLLWGF